MLLFKFVDVSIGVSVVVLALDFFFTEALVAGSTGCSVMCAGIGSVTEASIKTDIGAFSAFFTGEAVAGLSSPFLEDFFFFRVTSVQPSSAFFLSGPDPTLCLSKVHC